MCGKKRTSPQANTNSTRYHHTPMSTPTPRAPDTTGHHRMPAKMRSSRNSLSPRTGTQTLQVLCDEVWSFLTKSNILFPQDSAAVLLGIHPKELEIYIYTKTCTQMFTATLFNILKHGSNQDVLCSSVGELWSNQTRGVITQN